jgi:hypothetical protein
MTDITANLGLPVIAAAQAQKHVTHNEALRLLDILVQLAVLDRDLSAPPGSPNDGERWIVGPSPTGAWAGHADDVAAWQDGAWQFATPRSGWFAFAADESTLLVWNGSAWDDIFAAVAIAAIQNLGLLGVRTTADATNPFSAKLNNALWVAKTVGEGGDGDLRYKMSKESTADVLSLLMQTNFSGRAEIGLIGDDDLTVKVSPDGSMWFTGLFVDRSTGNVGIAGNVAPSVALDVAGSIKAEKAGVNAGLIASRVSGKSCAVGAGNTTSYFMFDNSGDFSIATQSSANVLAGAAAGKVDRLLVEGSSGRIAIGTTGPTVPLDVNGAIRTRPVTVASLSSASSAGMGARAFVSDANATTFGTVAAGGGANAVPVYSDGTNWRIG